MSLYWFLWSHPLLYTLHCPEVGISPRQSIICVPNNSHIRTLFDCFFLFWSSLFLLPCCPSLLHLFLSLSFSSSFLSLSHFYTSPLALFSAALDKQTDLHVPVFHMWPSSSFSLALFYIIFAYRQITFVSKLRIVRKKNYLKLLSTKRQPKGTFRMGSGIITRNLVSQFLDQKYFGMFSPRMPKEIGKLRNWVQKAREVSLKEKIRLASFTFHKIIRRGKLTFSII